MGNANGVAAHGWRRAGSAGCACGVAPLEETARAPQRSAAAGRPWTWAANGEGGLNRVRRGRILYEKLYKIQKCVHCRGGVSVKLDVAQCSEQAGSRQRADEQRKGGSEETAGVGERKGRREERESSSGGAEEDIAGTRRNQRCDRIKCRERCKGGWSTAAGKMQAAAAAA